MRALFGIYPADYDLPSPEDVCRTHEKFGGKTCDAGSQFAWIRKPSGFAQIREWFKSLLHIVRIALPQALPTYVCDAFSHGLASQADSRESDTHSHMPIRNPST